MNPIRFGAVNISLVRPGAVLKDTNKATTFTVDATLQNDYLPPDSEVQVFGKPTGATTSQYIATYTTKPYWGELNATQPTRIIDELDLVSHPGQV